MRVTIDVDTGAVTTVGTPFFTRRKTTAVDVIFQRAGNTIELASGAIGYVALNSSGLVAGGLTTSWSKSGSGTSTVYSFLLSCDTTQVEALFASQLKPVPAILSIDWVIASVPYECAPIAVLINNANLIGDEGTPAEIPDFKATDAQAIDSTDRTHWMTPHATAVAIAASAPAVISVNGKSGAVTLGPSDVGADPAGAADHAQSAAIAAANTALNAGLSALATDLEALVFATQIPLDYLIVGAGGGGFGYSLEYGGGGGGGHVLAGSLQLNSKMFSVTVGAGGIGTNGGVSTAGNASSFLNLIAAGGAAGTGAPRGQGDTTPGNGGNGAGANGASGSGTTGGNGGDGIQSSITGTAIYYGGGGGGGGALAYTSGTPGHYIGLSGQGLGGLGGGGIGGFGGGVGNSMNGGDAGSGQPGVDGLGGGGGGTAWEWRNGGFLGGKGGDGTVILKLKTIYLRYLTFSVAPTITTLDEEYSLITFAVGTTTVTNSAAKVSSVNGQTGDVTLTIPVPGIDMPKYLPGVSGLTGGGSSNLDGVTTVGLPQNYWVSFRLAGVGTQNYYLEIGSVPSGGAPAYVTPADNATSGAYWLQG